VNAGTDGAAIYANPRVASDNAKLNVSAPVAHLARSARKLEEYMW
jgi:hypothetical protein